MTESEHADDAGSHAPDAPVDDSVDDSVDDPAGHVAAEAAGPTEAIAALDVDGVAAVTAGTVVFAVAFVACLLLRGPLADSGRSWWTWVCLTGALLGLAGLAYVRRRAAAYAARA